MLFVCIGWMPILWVRIGLFGYLYVPWIRMLSCFSFFCHSRTRDGEYFSVFRLAQLMSDLAARVQYEWNRFHVTYSMNMTIYVENIVERFKCHIPQDGMWLLLTNVENSNQMTVSVNVCFRFSYLILRSPRVCRESATHLPLTNTSYPINIPIVRKRKELKMRSKRADKENTSYYAKKKIRIGILAYHQPKLNQKKYEFIWK